MAAKRKKARPKKLTAQETPPGFELLQTLRGHQDLIHDIAWSPDGRMVASVSSDRSIRFWNADSGKLRRTLEGHADAVLSVAWSPDGQRLASGSGDGTTWLWDVNSGKLRRQLKGHTHEVYSVEFSPDGRTLASGSADDTIRLWNVSTGKLRHVLEGSVDDINSVAWSPDGRTLASASDDDAIQFWNPADGELQHDLDGRGRGIDSVSWSPDGRIFVSGSYDGTIRLWHVATQRVFSLLESHTDAVDAVCFSHDGRLLASKSADDTVRLWRADTGGLLAVLAEPSSGSITFDALAFHPTEPILATLGEEDTVIRIWRLDYDKLLGSTQKPRKPSERASYYTNAKVVLVGNSSVGKTALGLVLAGRKFRATESTHGRHVWLFDEQQVQVKPRYASGPLIDSTRETLLWDLAGQPGYRLIHQLHLHEVAVALVLFDSRSETEPFAGVSYWARALDEATDNFPLVKFLVAARVDRGGVAASQDRIDAMVRKYGFNGFFKTSAKRGDGIDELNWAIRQAIAWDELPNVSSTDLFRAVKSFLVSEKKRGKILATGTELLDRFRKPIKYADTSREVFSTCLGRLEAAKLVRRLPFDDKVLLQPEMLDDYCGWLALAARDQPDGLGFLAEELALAGKFAMDHDRRLKGKREEKTLLLATVQEVLGRKIGIRQQTEQGPMIVFPSELNAELPNYPGGYSLAVAFCFQGPVSAIYATLAVTLIYSVPFEKKDLFKNAALFLGPQRQLCGFAVEYPDASDDALGRLTVFFEAGAERCVRLLFLRYVNQQLKHLAFKDSVERERIYHCEDCNRTIPADAVALRVKKCEGTVICAGCGRHYAIDTLAEETDEFVDELDRIDAEATAERQRQERLTVLKQREKARDFHVFLCHNSKDKPLVREVEQTLREQGILPWFDEQRILAGDRFPKKIEQAIDRAGVVAVFMGPHGLGQWQEQEYYAALSRSIEDRDDQGRPSLRLIPVLLPGVKRKPKLPALMRTMNCIDLRKTGAAHRQQVRNLVAAILDASGRR